MISGEGDIKYDSFTGRFFNDIGSGSLKQDPVTGDMWFDNGNFMDVNLQTYHLLGTGENRQKVSSENRHFQSIKNNQS